MIAAVTIGVAVIVVGAICAGVGAVIGFIFADSFAQSEIAFYRKRVEQLHHRLHAARSDGREAALFDPNRPRRPVGDHQETTPG